MLTKMFSRRSMFLSSEISILIQWLVILHFALALANTGNEELHCSPSYSDHYTPRQVCLFRETNVEIIDDDGFLEIFNKVAVNGEFLRHFSTRTSVSATGLHLLKLDESTFQYMIDLIVIDFSQNNIRVLPNNLLEKNLKLLKVSFNDNRISKVPASFFDHNKELREIYLQNNNIKELPPRVFKYLEKLKILDLSSNYLSSLSESIFLKLYTLERLTISNNQINYIKDNTFKDLHNLKHLDISSNQLHFIDEAIFQNMLNLSRLDLHKNNISFLPAKLLENNLRLRYFDVSQNSISKLTPDFFKNIETLRKIYINNNQLKQINLNCSEMPLIYDLHLHFNRLSIISENLFQKCYYIRRLKLSHNQIQYIEEKAFQDLISLEHLDISCNKIHVLGSSKLNESIFQNMSSLKTLLLYKNNITFLPKGLLKANENLLIIHLGDNKISRIPDNFFKNNKKLTKISLAKNNIKEMSSVFLTILVNLTELNLSFNNLTFLSETDFRMLPSLWKFNVSHNQIKYIENNSFENLNLNILDLSFNNLYMHNLPYFPQTVYILNLAHNKISKLPANWKYLSNLCSLDLSNNFLNFIKITDFNFIIKSNGCILDAISFPDIYLTKTNEEDEEEEEEDEKYDIISSEILIGNELFLTHNYISYFDLQNAPLGEEDIDVHIDGNPLKCDCNAIPLQNYLQMHELPYLFQLRASNLYCHSPNNLNKQRFQEVERDRLTCNPKSFICQKECECFPTSNGYIVDCQNATLKNSILFENAPDIDLLDLSFSKFPKNMKLTKDAEFVMLRQLKMRGVYQYKSSENENQIFSNIKNLSYLDFSHNAVNELSSSAWNLLEELTYLDVSFNNFTNISYSYLQKISKIKQFYFRNNQLIMFGSDSVFKLRELEILDLSYNLLDSFPVANCCSSLKELILESNNLAILTDELNLPSLEKINLNKNQIKAISWRWPPNLKDISAEFNYIQSIEDFGRIPHGITTLMLNHNAIKSLNVSDFLYLSGNPTIELKNNNIETIYLHPEINNMKKFRRISFFVNMNPLQCDCRLKSYIASRKKSDGIMFIEDSLICNSPSIMKNRLINSINESNLLCKREKDSCSKACSCYNNTITNLLDCTVYDCNAFPNYISWNVSNAYYDTLNTTAVAGFHKSFWQNLKELKIAKLTGNSTDFFSRALLNLTGLKTLKITKCTHAFPSVGFRNLTKLQNLHVQYCKLTTVVSDAFSKTTQLKQLSLPNNEISEISHQVFESMNDLESLDLSNNRIASLNFNLLGKCPKINRIDLSNNKLNHLPSTIFLPCKNLNSLNLANNSLNSKNINVITLIDTSLQNLNLSQNNIESLPQSLTEIELKTLDLSFNNISEIILDELLSFPSLEIKILLNHNKINKIVIPIKPQHFRQDIEIEISNNPLTCDCTLYEFLMLIQKTKLFHWKHLYCSHPPQLANISINSIQNSDLYCSNKEACIDTCECYSKGDDADKVIRNFVECRDTSLTQHPILQNNFVPHVLLLQEISNLTTHEILNPNWSNLRIISIKDSFCKISKEINFLMTSFQHLNQLQELHLSGNCFPNVADDLLTDLSVLRVVKLTGNCIQQISSTLFQDNAELISIDLSNNSFNEFPKNLLHKLYNLKNFSASRNKLQQLHPEFLFQLHSLMTLNLSYNEITQLPRDIFQFTNKLQILDLSHNSFFFPTTNMFHLPSSVLELNYSYNALQDIPEESWNHTSANRLQVLNIAHNNISNLKLQKLLFTNHAGSFINLDDNNIEHVDVNISQFFSEQWNPFLKISLNGNPVICDCKIVKFRNQVQDLTASNITASFEFIIPEHICSLKKQLVTHNLSITLGTSICFEENCPKPCQCISVVGKSNQTIMNCSNTRMLHFPNEIPSSVAAILADHNNISDLEHPQFADLIAKNNLCFISLTGNQLERPNGWLQEYVIQSKPPSFAMNLSGNPWLCDCDTLPFQKWLSLNHSHHIEDILDIMCSDNKQSLLSGNFCSKILTTVLLIISTIAAVMLFGAILYFRNKNAIHIWLYSKGYCGFLFKEDAIDKDKEFDAFVCYSSDDHDFVFDHLIPALEDEPPYFNLCIHERDWRAGELIIEQIANSISSSRRIIIILSESFVKSNWSMFEFQAANFQSLQDKINRIIIIVLGQLPSRELMSSDMKMHIDMYTYLEWKDRKKFFDKLKFAMPRKRYRNNRNTNVNYDSTLQLVTLEIV